MNTAPRFPSFLLVLSASCLGVLVGGVALGTSDAAAQDVSILALPVTSSEKSSAPRVRHLVLYLYTARGTPTVIERAAITEGTSRETGTEIQELRELAGLLLPRRHLISINKWQRDLNFDGEADLVFPCSRVGGERRELLYIFDAESNSFKLADEGEYFSEPTLVYSAGD